MKKFFFTKLLILLFISTSYAQIFQPLIKTSYNDWNRKIEVLPNNNILTLHIQYTDYFFGRDAANSMEFYELLKVDLDAVDHIFSFVSIYNKDMDLLIKKEFHSNEDSIFLYTHSFHDKDDEEIVLMGSVYNKDSLTRCAIWLDYDLNEKHKIIYNDSLELTFRPFIVNSNNNIVAIGKNGFELSKTGDVVRTFPVNAIGLSFFENSEGDYITISAQSEIVNIYDPQAEHLEEVLMEDEEYVGTLVLHENYTNALSSKKDFFYVNALKICKFNRGVKSIILRYNDVDYTSEIFYEDPTENCFATIDFYNGIDLYYDDYIYFVNKAESCDFLNFRRSCETEYVVVNNLDEKGNLRWSKYIGGDALYETKGIYATPDSGCLVSVSRFKYGHNLEFETDNYYMKFDKNGNAAHQFPVAVEDVPLFTEEIRLIPNPVSDYFTVKFPKPEAEPVKIDVFDLSGKKVLSVKVEHQPISVNDLSTGYYTYLLYTTAKNIKSGKLIKL